MRVTYGKFTCERDSGGDSAWWSIRQNNYEFVDSFYICRYGGQNLGIASEMNLSWTQKHSWNIATLSGRVKF